MTSGDADEEKGSALNINIVFVLISSSLPSLPGRLLHVHLF